ncbi:DUF309 domain-containing protein [Jeotgalibacillus sp. JSM ZJ347]|uniref:DUF309 domain-containing protein n=1 Tax=Jeotgalibacillus sp. JSM ZJ347 TaxID=3342117 RepID=UPI0035A96961
MHYPDEYIRFLVHFHGDRDYFECHEILEEYWKEHTDENKNSLWVGLIQLAVALYHHRRRNFKGALRMIRQAKQKITTFSDEARHLSLDTDKLLIIISEIESAILVQSPYRSIMLPLSDDTLIERCKTECNRHGFTWGGESNLSNKALVDRHKLRDRSDIILLRKEALLSKSKLNPISEKGE